MADSARSYRSKAGDTVDSIAWSHYGSLAGGQLEALLEANPGLAGRGDVLPAGELITLPVVEASADSSVVTLWS